MILHSKPHTVEGFRFYDGSLVPPKWFQDAVRQNRASVTMNSKGRYITLYTKEGNVERAMWGDWVCINGAGKLYTITHAECTEAYEIE